MTLLSAFPTVAPPPAPDGGEAALVRALRAEGAVSTAALMRAAEVRRRHGGRLVDALLAGGAAPEGALYAALARHRGLQRIDPAALPPEAALLARWGAARALRDGVLPWRRAGGRVIVLVSHPDDLVRHGADLAGAFGPVAAALAPRRAIEEAVLAAAGAPLARAAEHTVPAGDSGRAFGGLRGRIALGALGALLLLLLLNVPGALILSLTAIALLALVLGTGLKGAAALAALRATPPPPAPVTLARRPVVSIMVALYRECGIAPRLVRRLERLDYPRELLDVVLVTEADDTATRAALLAAGLPPWMRIATVPAGRLQTKPRALNFALNLCRGSVIGVYDAEDAPAPDQISFVVQRFAELPAQVACLQGVLDFYNPRANWMARAFTLEYAAWFRMVLPGIARLGLPVPLGGTTLFFRREALERLGAWDAWNVTEDADLGIRLARRGYRTAVIPTVTGEEANCRPWPWVRQRSRWIKGYMMTWAVHMRRPRALWRELGAREFLGFQVMFLGAIVQFLLAPLLWSFWLVTLGAGHPVAAALPGWGLPAAVGLFLMAEAVTLAVGWAALRRSGHRLSPLWLLTLHAYYPLATVAAWKAAWEMVVRPFYWDKTAHGVAEGAVARAVPPARAPEARARALDTARRLHPLLLPAGPRARPPPLLRRAAPPRAPPSAAP